MKTRKQHRLDAAGLCDRLVVVVRLARLCGETAGLERGKATADPHLKARHLGKEMRHHLCVNILGDAFCLPLQHVERLVFRQITAQVLHHLPRQVVEQCGLGEIVDVVVIHQLPHDVILRALLGDAALDRQPRLFVAMQPLNH